MNSRPESLEPSNAGAVKLNSKGALARGEAERIARVLAHRDGIVTASSFSEAAYGDDTHGNHTAASSALGGLVKRGVMKRKKVGQFVLNTDKPKRNYTKKNITFDVAIKEGDEFVFIGMWKDHFVMAQPDEGGRIIIFDKML